MAKVDKREKFIRKATKKFGNKFDYSNVEYVCCDVPVKIVCPKHGEFLQTPALHLSSKYGCPKCGNEHHSKPLLGKEYVIEKSREKFGDKYDFSKFEYKGITEKSCIICPKHGEFWTTPNTHLRSKTGCPKCGLEQMAEDHIIKTDEFIEKARKVHGNKYDYSKVDCHGWYSYVTIICPEHGEFVQRTEAHLRGAGCSKCANVIPPITQDEYIKRCETVYGSKYALDNIRYKNIDTAIFVNCEKHGEFKVRPKTFLKGGGCPLCKKEKEFINNAVEKHGDKYDYSKVVYKGSNVPVCIIDKERGEFWQKPSNHLNGIGNNFPFDLYGYCKSVAEQYTTMNDFYENRKHIYAQSVKHGWIDEFTWLEKGTFWEEKLRVVYVYEMSDGSVYVGLTKNMDLRDKAHRGLTSEHRKSSVREYCLQNGLEIPKPRILESGLTVTEAQASERKWIREYKNRGVKVINKTDGGEIGVLPFFAYECKPKQDIIKEASEYKCMEEIKRKNQLLYYFIRKNNLTDECFPNRRKCKTPHRYTEEFILDVVKKCPRKIDLRNYDPAIHQYLFEHGLLYKYYPKGRVFEKL